MSRMFSGLMSRWTTPCWWAYSSAAGRLGGDPERGVHRELPLPAEPVAEALALDERHGEPEPAVGLARVEHGEDVRMLQPGGEADLPLEPLGAEAGGQVQMEHLERDRPVVPEVLRQPDRGHAAAAELALEGVAVPQSRAQCCYRIGHGTRCRG